MTRTEEEKIADEIDLALFQIYERVTEMREKLPEAGAWVVVAIAIQSAHAQIRTRMSATRRAETRG